MGLWVNIIQPKLGRSYDLKVLNEQYYNRTHCYHNEKNLLQFIKNLSFRDPGNMDKTINSMKVMVVLVTKLGYMYISPLIILGEKKT